MISLCLEGAAHGLFRAIGPNRECCALAGLGASRNPNSRGEGPGLACFGPCGAGEGVKVNVS